MAPLAACLRRWSVVMALLLVLPLGLGAAPAPSDTDLLSPAEKVRKALDQTINLSQANEELQKVLDHLHELTKVPFILDHATLQQMGIDADEGGLLVSIDVKNVKVRTALRMLLNRHNLGFTIVGDSVVVTTPEMSIYRQLRQPVNVDLDGVPLNRALKQLARQTAANLVLDPRLGKEGEAAVTLQLDEVPLETAVRLMAEMAGLKPARMGNVLFVTTEVRANKLQADGEMTAPGASEDAGFPSLPRIGLKAPRIMVPPGVPGLPPAAPPAPADKKDN